MRLDLGARLLGLPRPRRTHSFLGGVGFEPIPPLFAAVANAALEANFPA